MDLQYARVAAHAGDCRRVQNLSRNLVELARALGLSELAAFGSQLEDAARRQSAQTTLALIDRISSYLEHVHVVYQRPARRAG